MGEINHFMHKQHSLKLIENLEVVVGVGDEDDNDQEEKGVVNCVGCLEPISSASAYGCILCRCFLHKTCAEIASTINHHFHPLHPLTLIDHRYSGWDCDVCGKKDLKGGFNYRCDQCDFDACMKCSVAAIAIKEEVLIRFQHVGHPQHTLILQSRSASILCDACHAKDEDLFYQCDSCDFWIHKTCTSLPLTIHLPNHPNHSLDLVYSLPDNFYNFKYYCDFCDKTIIRNDWLYHCANCRYFAHIKCALNADQVPSISSVALGTFVAEDENDHVLHFPMSEALKLLHSEKYAQDDDENKEINHWSHDGPLILNLEPQLQGNNVMPNIGCSDPIEVCDGCVRPLSLPYYSCKHIGCSFTLHKYCAELPLILQHQLHPDHSLHLVDMSDDEYYYGCHGCFSQGNRFAYKCTETCEFYLDVNCAFLPNTIKHEHHNHPLIQVINDPKTHCKACYKMHKTISYACKSCNFLLGMHCAIRSPHFLAHRYCKGHDIPLTRLPVENHPEDFYCDICEEEMHPLQTIYHCLECKNSFHLECLSHIDRYANVKHEFTKTVSYHKHPLTFVRRKKTPEYVCFGCNLDINGHLILECRTGTCPYRICMSCHRKK